MKGVEPEKEGEESTTVGTEVTSISSAPTAATPTESEEAESEPRKQAPIVEVAIEGEEALQVGSEAGELWAGQLLDFLTFNLSFMITVKLDVIPEESSVTTPLPANEQGAEPPHEEHSEESKAEDTSKEASESEKMDLSETVQIEELGEQVRLLQF